MKYQLNKVIIESALHDSIQADFSNKMDNIKQNAPIIRKQFGLDDEIVSDRKKDIAISLNKDKIEESLTFTKHKLVSSGIAPTQIAKSGISQLNKEGMNANLLGKSNNDVLNGQARNVNGTDHLESLTESISPYREKYRSNSSFNQKKEPVESMYQRRIKRDDGTRPLIKKGEKELRSRVGLDNSNGERSRSLRITDQYKNNKE